MIWTKLPFLRALFPSRGAAGEVAKRWFTVRTHEPQLAHDLIRLGGILSAQPTGPDGPELLDPARMAYEAGRRDLALSLLAMMSLTVSELNELMENADV
jgi:hypothetical protein